MPLALVSREYLSKGKTWSKSKIKGGAHSCEVQWALWAASARCMGRMRRRVGTRLRQKIQREMSQNPAPRPQLAVQRATLALLTLVSISTILRFRWAASAPE